MGYNLLLLLTCVLVARAVTAQEVLPTVEVKGKRPRSPQKRSVAPKEIHEDAPFKDAERNIPGILVRSSGPGQRTVVSIEGLPSSGTVVTLGGVPISSPYLGGADLSQLLPFSGTSLLLIEPGATTPGGSGTTPMIKIELPRMKRGTTGFSVTTGSLQYGALGIRSRISLGDWDVLVLSGTRMVGGTFPFTDRNDHQRIREHNASVAAEGLVELSRTADSSRLNLTLDLFGDYREVPGLEQYPSTTATQRDLRSFASLRYSNTRYRPWNVRASSYVSYKLFRYKDSHPPIGPSLDTTLHAIQFMGEADIRLSAISWFVPGIHLRIEEDLGFTIRRTQRQHPCRGILTADGSLFFKGGWFRLSLHAGTRLLRFTNPYPFVQGALQLRPLRGMVLFASTARTFRPPTFDELYFDAFYVKGNPQLHPEVGWRIRSGIQGHLEHISLELAYFWNRLENLILFLPKSAYVIEASNSGDVFSQGAEATLYVEWRDLFSKIVYTYTHATMQEGRTLPYTPEHRVYSTWGWKGSRLGLSLVLGWQDRFYMDRFENLSSPARLDLSVFVTYHLMRSVTLRVWGRNLLDYTTWVDSFQNPLPGRQFFVSLAYLGGGVR